MVLSVASGVENNKQLVLVKVKIDKRMDLRNDRSSDDLIKTSKTKAICFFEIWPRDLPRKGHLLTEKIFRIFLNFTS